MEKSFDTIFNMGYGGGVQRLMGRENRPYSKGLKVVCSMYKALCNMREREREKEIKIYIESLI